jgi:Ser/Thr protein kinase RdoA (MazF antagonist)
LADIEPAVSPDETNLYQTVTTWALPNVRKQNEQRSLGLGDDFFDDYLSGFGVLHGKLPRQLIHGDLHPSNILFVDKAVSGFIDFEASEISIRLWDVCYCATGMLCGLNESEYDKWFDFLRGILRGYDDGNKLTGDEKQAVFDVICSIQMVFIAYCEGQEKFKPLAETNRKMLQFIVMNKPRLCRIGNQV